MYSTMNTRGGSARHTRRATGGEWRALAWLCRHPGWLLVPALLALAALRVGAAAGRRHASAGGRARAGGVGAAAPALLRPLGRPLAAPLLAALDGLPRPPLGRRARSTASSPATTAAPGRLLVPARAAGPLA